MTSEQFCEQLQNNQWISHQISFGLDLDLSQSLISFNQEDYITQKLKNILSCLQKEKNQFISAHRRQQEALVKKIHTQKDKIIDDLLKTIHNLKNENGQLKFQYRKRFKVIKCIEQKYQDLIETKNKKITELESILKYLESKIKLLQMKLEKNDTHERIENENNRQFFSPKHKRTFSSQNEIDLRFNKKVKDQKTSRKLPFITSLDECTIPLSSSFISDSKVSLSSKTIQKKKFTEGSQILDFSVLKGHFVQTDVYCSFLTSDPNCYGNRIDNESNIEDLSGIAPLYLGKSHCEKKSQILEDFDDFKNK